MRSGSRSPSIAGGSSRSRRRSPPRTAGPSHAGSARPAATAAACSPRRTRDPGALQRRTRPHPRPPRRARGHLPGARSRADQRRGLRDGSCLGRPRAARSTVVVAGEDEASRAARPARGAGLRRRRRPGDRRVSASSRHPARRSPRGAGRQVDLAPCRPSRRARARARPRSAASAARRTPRRRSARPGARRSTVYEHGDDTLHVIGNGLRGLRPPGRPLDCANAGTLDAPVWRASSPGSMEAVRARRRRVALVAPDGARRRAAAPDGRASSRRPTGHAPVRIEGGPLRPRSPTSCRSRAPRSSRRSCSPACSPRRRDHRRRAETDARPHRAHARGRRA